MKSVATLSYWRSGQRRPDGVGSLAAISDLEELLGLDPGALVNRLVPPSRPGPLLPPRLRRNDGYDVTEVRETLDLVQVESPDGLRHLTDNVTVDVDDRGALRRSTLQLVLQAREDGVATFRHLVYVPRPQTDPPEYVAGAGCQVQSTHAHPGRRVYGAVLALDRVLLAGQSTVVEFRVELPPTFAHEDWYQHTASRRMREVLLWVRFDPRNVPVRYEEYNDAGDGSTAVQHTVSGGSIHLVRRNFGPGTVGLRWWY